LQKLRLYINNSDIFAKDKSMTPRKDAPYLHRFLQKKKKQEKK